MSVTLLIFMYNLDIVRPFLLLFKRLCLFQCVHLTSRVSRLTTIGGRVEYDGLGRCYRSMRMK